jgi:hypothetical protein
VNSAPASALVFSLRNLCVLCGSAVFLFRQPLFTAESQRTQRLRREKIFRIGRQAVSIVFAALSGSGLYLTRVAQGHFIRAGSS